jgi:hypothetical protein
MVWWAAIAAAVVVCTAVVSTAVVSIVAIGAWARRRRGDDALDYDDFVQLGRAAWVDLRDDDRTRLTK